MRLPRLDLSEDDEEFETKLTEEVRKRIEAEHPDWSADAVEHLTTVKGRIVEPYPEGMKGYVVTGKRRLGQFDPEFLDDDNSSYSPARAVTLDEHSRGVADHARRFAAGCGLPVEAYTLAGLHHDLGKLDPRFQAMLRQSSPRTAVGDPLAKSARSPRTKAERDAARDVHQYPVGARHELLSAAVVGGHTSDDLLLHLIATHHGSARPFAAAVQEDGSATAFPVDQFGLTLEWPSARQDIAGWNAELPERFWRVVRKYGWWGAAYREAVFRLADHAQSRAEQEGAETVAAPPSSVTIPPPAPPRRWHPLPLTGLDGSNPLAFLAALGTLAVCDQISRSDPPEWLAGGASLSWGHARSPSTPVLNLRSVPPPVNEFVKYLAARLVRSVEEHPSSWVVRMLELGLAKGADRDFRHVRRLALPPSPADRLHLDWATALSCETAIDADSQLQTVRCDYLIGNLRSLLAVATADHVRRSLFDPWDYADPLSNQSLHWEPAEDRRHSHQWHQPNGDPTRSRRGGMVGANRLALEAWPLFPSFASGSAIRTRGFRGNRAANTYWTWPLWSSCLTHDAVAAILSLAELHPARPRRHELLSVGVTAAFRSRRILFGKTPNLTPSEMVV